MPTEKPRFSITMDEGLFQQIEDFKYNGRYKNQTKAVVALIEKGLEVLSTEDPEIAKAIKNSPGAAEAAPGDTLCSTLLHNFDQLNQEGQERLVETSDDMVASGKYIKSGQNNLGGEKMA